MRSVSPNSFQRRIQFLAVWRLACQPATFSMKLTPLPLTVSARMTTGLPRPRGPSRKPRPIVHVGRQRADLPSQRRHISHPAAGTSITSSPTVNLQAIGVDDGDDVIQMEMSGFHGASPNLALLLFAVAHQAEDFVLLLVESADRAIPTAMLRPWPSEPEETSSQGVWTNAGVPESASGACAE